MHSKGFLSIHTAKVVRRISNSYEIQFKGYDDDYVPDVIMDQMNENYGTFSGKKIIVPARDIIPANKVQYNKTLQSTTSKEHLKMKGRNTCTSSLEDMTMIGLHINYMARTT